MGGSGAFATGGIAFAALGGACLCTAALKRGKERVQGAYSLGLEKRSALFAFAIFLVQPFRPLVERMLRHGAVCEGVSQAKMVLRASWPEAARLDGATLVSLGLGVTTGVAFLSLVFTRSLTFAVAVACLLVLGLWGVLCHKAEGVSQAIREAVPDALRLLADSFRSGHSLQQTMEQAATDLTGPIQPLFQSVAKRLRIGEGAAEALTPLGSVKDVPELAFVAIALDVQHQSGGSIAPVLESAREAVRGELELARSLRVQTAQARLSASIVTVMPFILIAFFSLASPGFLDPFFESPLGVILLGIALVMQLVGVLSVRRICRADQ